MINKNLKEGVLKLKWMWVEVYKDIFRNGKNVFGNRKECFLRYIRIWFEIAMVVG